MSVVPGNIEKNLSHLLQLRFGIIGDSPQIREAIRVLEQAAPTDLTVLITGETGTGKEVFANAIHGLSKRRLFPFVSVNCGAIPETLLEAELFGNEKGAFTGAVEQRKGFFEVANKGTIFLDEIGDMPIGTQVKILRALESGEFSRLGSSSVQKVDVRVLAATNRDLQLEVAEGKFRRDLFFRLNSVHIKLPALRTHPQDVPLLIEHFAEKVSEKISVAFEGVSGDSMSILKSLPWQGNIRELKNLVDTIVTLEKGAYITPEMLKRYIPPALPEYKFLPTGQDSSLVHIKREDTVSDDASLMFKTLLELKNDVAEIKRALLRIDDNVDEIGLDLNDMKNKTATYTVETADTWLFDDVMDLATAEKILIKNALKKFSNNRRQAAQALGISERTLYRKLAEHGLE